MPGFGVRNVQRMLKIRKYAQLRLQDLGRLRISLNRAKPFIITADHNLSVMRLDCMRLPEQFQQMSLFDSTITAITGEL